LGRILRSGGLLYFIILMVFAVILVRVLSAGNPDVKELNNLQFRKLVEEKAFVTDLPKGDPNTLTIKDEDQIVTGLYKPKGGGQQREFRYPYTSHTDVAAQLNKADIPFEVDPPKNGFWFTLIGTLAPILLIVLFFILFMSSMQGGGNRVMSFGKSRARRMTQEQTRQYRN
jgi:cell division protease FtsH